MGQKLGMSLRQCNNDRYCQILLQKCFSRLHYTTLVALKSGLWQTTLYPNFYLKNYFNERSADPWRHYHKLWQAE